MKKYIILLAVALLFGACEKDDDINSDATKIAERTVLIYMAADNNLYQFLMNDLREMKEGSKQLGNQQNLIIYVDQSNSNPTFIARIKDGILVDSTALPERSTADPAVLEEMLRYTCENYPARSYGLGLWGRRQCHTVVSHKNGMLVKVL